MENFNVRNLEIYNEDALVYLPKIESGSIDMIYCDLPYGTTQCKWEIMGLKNTEMITTEDNLPIISVRQRALIWWNKMNLEEQFYVTIEHNELIQGDCTRHPLTLTGTEIEIIWMTHVT